MAECVPSSDRRDPTPAIAAELAAAGLTMPLRSARWLRSGLPLRAALFGAHRRGEGAHHGPRYR